MADDAEKAELARMAAELDALGRYADAQEKKAAQLQVALDSRVVIEQAVGILSERFELSIAEAFDLLRSAARNSRRELRALATELTESRATPAAVTVARGT